MIKSTDIRPSLGSVAGQAFRREPKGHVVHYLRGSVILLVAGETVGGKGAEGTSLVIGMTGLAANLKMGPLAGETQFPGEP